MTQTQTDPKKAILYRMVLPDHVCPFGLKALKLLEDHGYEVEDHLLETREETDAFKAQHGVPTTPIIWIDGERIDSSAALERYLTQ